MVWSTPPTFTSGAVLTAAQLNILSADLNETAAAKATAAGQHFISTAANQLVPRAIVNATVATNETTASTSYAALTTPGPTCSGVLTGATAVVMITCFMQNNTAASWCAMSYDVSVATVLGASDSWAFRSSVTSASEHARATAVSTQTGLTSGSNTFRGLYKVNTGTGSFSERQMLVIPYS